MPRTRSAKKNVRKTLKLTLRNRLRRERLKKVVRKFHDAVQTKDQTRTQETLTSAQRALDKAASKGFIHRNAANRKKSRLAKAARKAAAQG